MSRDWKAHSDDTPINHKVVSSPVRGQASPMERVTTLKVLAGCLDAVRHSVSLGGHLVDVI